jgi:hypothetical protein
MASVASQGMAQRVRSLSAAIRNSWSEIERCRRADLSHRQIQKLVALVFGQQPQPIVVPSKSYASLISKPRSG